MNTDEALKKIRDNFHKVVEKLDRGTYREVLGEFLADLAGAMEALDEEESEE